MKRLWQLFDDAMWRFLLVGVINTVVGTAIMYALYNLVGVGYWLSSAANYILTSILSYFLNKHFTFRATERGWRPAVRFALNIVVCYVLAYGIAQPLTRWVLRGVSLTLRENVAMAVGMVFFTGFNYLGQRLFAFRRTEEDTR